MTTPEQHRRLDDEFITRREAEALLVAGRAAVQQAKEAHDAVHESQLAALKTAMNVAQREREVHTEHHGREHELHAEKHDSQTSAVRTALDAVGRERQIHAEAHEREHLAHQREHHLANVAIEKAERANDLRFNAANAFREQLNDVIRTLASKESLESHMSESERRIQDLRKNEDRRYEELRASIVALEKGDVKGEGRALGQGAVIAVILGGITTASAILGLIIVMSNLLTGTPTNGG